MTQKLAPTLLLVVALVAAMLLPAATTAPSAQAATAWAVDTWGLPRETDNVILKWNEQLLEAVRRNAPLTGPTRTARHLGILHTATYDAWAAYDATAVGTRRLGGLRQLPAARTPDNRNMAINYAAYRVLMDLFPENNTQVVLDTRAMFTAKFRSLGGDPSNTSTDTGTPAGVGNVVADAVLTFRHADGSNQLNNYADTTGYKSVNTADTVVDRWRWQPLCVPLPPAGTPCTSPSAPQQPLTPQWGWLTSFALTPGTGMPGQYTIPGPRRLPDGSYDPSEVDDLLAVTSNLTDSEKARAEYWADGPKTEFPPGHMAVFAQALSRMRRNTLDQDAKLFFALGNALMDASISSWRAKYQWDFVRPTTAIRERYRGQMVTSWRGPGRGFGLVPGESWQPYQALNVVTPGFPEYVSGHSTFSAAGRTVLAAFYGTESFNATVTIRAGSSKIEPGVTPARDVVLRWKTLTDVADDAGWSRRWGGIHFQSGDEHGRLLGRLAGYNVWTKAQTYFNGTATSPT